MNRGEMHIHYLYGRKIMGERTRREEPRGPNGHGPRGQGIWPRGAYPFAPRALFRPPLLTTPSSLQERVTLFFLRFHEVAATAKPLPPSRGVRSCRSGGPEKGKLPPSSPPLLLGVGGGVPFHHHHRHDPLRPPRNLRVTEL
jgi:hypothetical protein